ncbi:thymidylate kinase [Polymorphobacter multimanifer]|uniref:Thymidylate kinase n=1 Tax=Polymorphobacter multimanifer TaxID=1070431 RepID=A0A841L0G6_9SPHN|nr:dTMP kinase [Polymorphobacter multimanifer]MBB6226034.1 dTMP kinase [Polymorphobacter multimanifer]GGI79441.1 thymidylate kinase [Polymorphobacter multimanifer]
MIEEGVSAGGENGRFISFEGGEGCGKSTQAHRLAEALTLAGHEVVLTREPGGTEGAEAIRSLLVSGDPGRWLPWSEACLVNAARAEHVTRVIRPALRRGAWVLCDRYIDSTRAYQGAGKGLDDAALTAMHAQVTRNLWPDLTLVLGLPVEQGLARAATRSRAGKAETRFEAHDAGFHGRVEAFFAALPAAEPWRCVAIDASGTIADVGRRIRDAAESWTWS